MPLVSVIIPSFNCEAVLEPCLSAIRNSTFKDYEIIVVDGQSVDRTQEIARRYANKLLVPPVNREPTPTMSCGPIPWRESSVTWASIRRSRR
jgi:glycosyltransferase involved in cell wall biosynthesis